MLATLLLSGLVLAEPGATISYHKKVMIDPGYKPSRTAEAIRETLAESRRPARVVHHLSPPPVRRVVYAVEPRARWNAGVSYGGYHDGWATGVGVSYGYPTTYAYAYPTYRSPWSWSFGLGYRTSWGYLGLGLANAHAWCGPRHGHTRRYHR